MRFIVPARHQKILDLPGPPNNLLVLGFLIVSPYKTRLLGVKVKLIIILDLKSRRRPEQKPPHASGIDCARRPELSPETLLQTLGV